MATSSHSKASNPVDSASSSDSDSSDYESSSTSDSELEAPLSALGNWTKRDLSRDLPDVPDTFLPTKITSNSSPIDCIRQFFDNEFIDLMVQQSNLYATQQNIRLSSQITESDIWKFIGGLLYMSCISLPRVKDYWKHSIRQPILADAVPRDRFLETMRVLHFNYSALEPGKNSGNFDKIYKIRPAIEYLNSRFLDAVVPEGFHSIDEQMIKWKGKTAPGGLKQYLPLKPISHGYKLYTRAGVSGYVY